MQLCLPSFFEEDDMSKIELYEHQMNVLPRIHSGCVLCGGVGSGKSITSLGYYYICNGGNPSSLCGGEYVEMKNPKDLYIITTARKRDTLDWEKEMAPFLLSTDPECNHYRNKVVVDSWNKVQDYKTVTNAFFIFDEQRVVGSGPWVTSFLNIARHNEWILLSATPGDSWKDYIPVFVANGFYKNRTAFIREHVIYSRFSKYPSIEGYMSEGKLEYFRRQIVIDMDFERPTKQHHEFIAVDYDTAKYKDIMRRRWDIWKDEPITNAGGLCYALRKIVNCDESRAKKIKELTAVHPRAIIFYNFDYELEILKAIKYSKGTAVAEWNGHRHEPIPGSERWVYLVQYTAGAEGWNCIETDTVIFYSQNYSYKVIVQSSGRIDRLNTPYRDLYYYHLKSKSSIDVAIGRALKEKKTFNENRFTKGSW